MKTTAAVLFEAGKPFELMELDLDGPGPGEVLVKYTAAGLCHSDLHLTDGDLPPRFPIVGGHEGSGVIEEVGAGVTRVKPGDHVVCSFIPNCGTCRYCCTGRQNLCDMGATILEGCMPDGSFRFHSQGTDFGAMCMLGTFAERATVSQHSVVKVVPPQPAHRPIPGRLPTPAAWSCHAALGPTLRRAPADTGGPWVARVAERWLTARVTRAASVTSPSKTPHAVTSPR